MINDFTLISMSSAIEPLRMANHIGGDQIHACKTLSETDQSVTASDGLSINVDSGIDNPEALDNIDVVNICGGCNV